MITPWSTNAVEITQNMGINGIKRIEEFFSYDDEYLYDIMTNELYQKLDQNIFSIEIQPEKIFHYEGNINIKKNWTTSIKWMFNTSM